MKFVVNTNIIAFTASILWGLSFTSHVYASEKELPSRILSGMNSAITLEEQKTTIYLMPINYQAEEAGLGFISAKSKLQNDELAQPIAINSLGTAIIAQPGQPESLFLSISVNAVIPSECHRLAVEERNPNGQPVISVWVYSAVPRNRVCPRRPVELSAAFVLPQPLPLDQPIDVLVNAIPVRRIVRNENEVIMLTDRDQWKITRLKEIIGLGQWNQRWQNEWWQGKALPPKPTPKPPQTPPPEKPPEEPLP